MFCGSSSRCHRLIVLFPDHTHLLLEAMAMEIIGSIALFGMYFICLPNEHISNRYEACNYGGLFVPFRYFVLSSFRLAIWRGAKTK